MVEADLAVPVLLPVAGVAGRLELRAVRIRGAVAGEAVGAELLCVDIGRVAHVTVEFRVDADQREFRLGQVVVFHRPPLVVIVAAVAFAAKTPGVRIVGFVAAVAILRDLVLEISAPVAAGAVDLRVVAEQCKARLLLVIESGFLPAGGGVALAAVSAALAAMRVVRGMAADAGFRRGLVAAAEMAAAAAHGHVCAGERKGGLVMVEARTGPVVHVVAIITGRGQLALVVVVLFVTTETGGLRLAIGLTLLVAAEAGQRAVRAREREFRALVVELEFVQAHDVAIPADVLGMATRALAGSGVRHAAVETVMVAHINSDVLVAVEAKRALTTAVGAVVAVGAGFLELGVRGSKLAGHQQALHGRGMRGRGSHQACCCHQIHEPTSSCAPHWKPLSFSTR